MNDPPEPEPKNTNPFEGQTNAVLLFVESYGWLILLAVVVCFYLKSKVMPKVQEYQQQRNETMENKKFDPETTSAREAAREAARQRMQEQLDAQAARHAEQMKAREEEKRKQKIEDWEGHIQGKGYRSKQKVPDSTDKPQAKKPGEKSKPLRPTDYNPLMGDGGSCSWRPGVRRGGAGGG